MRPTAPSRITAPFLRLTAHHRTTTPSPFLPLPHHQPHPSRAFHLTRRVLAQEAYGNSSNPAPSPNAGSPSESHPSSEQTQKREHPGPESPVTAGGAKEGGGTGGSKAQPKILNEEGDKGQGQGQEEGVKRHNEEMSKRHDRPQEKDSQADDKVGKGFWKGQGGADRDP